MDLRNIPNHVWWIITPSIIIPFGIFILMLGYLIYSYASILPHAKNINIKVSDLELVTEFADSQLAINKQVQTVISQAQLSIDKTISDYQKILASTGFTNSSTSITQLKDQAAILKTQQEQLNVINGKLMNFKSSIHMYNSKENSQHEHATPMSYMQQ